jgi:hypothetical protein
MKPQQTKSTKVDKTPTADVGKSSVNEREGSEKPATKDPDQGKGRPGRKPGQSSKSKPRKGASEVL